MKNIVVLGSTGSIGTQTLDVAAKRKEEFSVKGLAAYGNRPELFARQIADFEPEVAVVYDESRLSEVKEAYEAIQRKAGSTADLTGHEGKAPEFLTGMEGLEAAAALPDTELVVTGLVGMIGIRPTVAAIRAGKDIALANKETLACCGDLIMRLAKEKGVRILPVDSEHCALFECMQGVKPEEVKSLILTCSGGPFRGYSREELEKVTLAQALKHPNWAMGAKITVDSASLMNKGIEMIEAKFLYDRKPEEIEVIIHPESIVHSMVRLKDGMVMAQLGPVDMRLPIEAMLYYPERGPLLGQELDFAQIAQLHFEAVDEEAFPSLALSRRAMQRGGLYPAVYNAANELANEAFRRGEIGFTEIFRRVEGALNEMEKRGLPDGAYTIEEAIEIRETVKGLYAC